MNEQEVKQYILNNLSLDIREQMYGFNGVHIVVKLILDGTVISEEYVDIKRDEG